MSDGISYSIEDSNKVSNKLELKVRGPDCNFSAYFIISQPLIAQAEAIILGLKGKKLSLKCFYKGKELEKTASIYSI